MTQQELTALNPWAKYPNFKGMSYRFYYEDTDLIHPLDKEVVDEYNNGRARQYCFERHVPPFPFQGNPFCAKVVFLSLNPGFVERINKDAALLLEHTNTCIYVNDIWYQHMIHGSTSMFPPINQTDQYTAYQLLQDWYWEDMLASLRKDCKLNTDIFNERIALIQLMPYSSTACNKAIINLPTQQYTKQLIHYLLEQPDGPLFVVMRSEPEWGKLLGIDFDNSRYKNRFILRKRDKQGHRPRSQFINESAFVGKGYKKIINKINN